MDSGQILFRETIFALSSGALPAGVAVVRASGPGVRALLQVVIGTLPPARSAWHGHIRDKAGEVLDRAIVLFFPGPRSFTGEDVAEFHLHGGRAVVAALFEMLRSIDGLRPAEAGEFTRRAFLHGKMDLAAAEGIADLVAAETEAQRRFAVANSAGRQSELYDNWRARIVRGRAMIEAELDFSDEADVPGSVSGAVWEDMAALVREMRRHLAGYHRAEIIREGFQVVIAGAPNAGKSSLMNALARRDVAIVSTEAGTTRDVVEATLDIHGFKVVLADTAGIRDDPGAVEAMGILRARQRIAAADLVALLTDMAAPCEVSLDSGPGRLLRVGTKLDLAPAADPTAYDICISAATGDGVAALLDRIGSHASEAAGRSFDILPSRARHVNHLSRAARALERAIGGSQTELELRAEEMRLAGEAIGRIAGRVDVEDLLDEVFSRFCIGK